MGLDTSHDCWHGSYSSFAAWREEICRAAGKGDPHEFRAKADALQIPPRTYQGWWDEDPADPLDVLLLHSDCDGYIFPEHAEALADRLARIDLSVTDGSDPGDEGWFADLRDMFVAGLRDAAERWEVVVFH